MAEEKTILPLTLAPARNYQLRTDEEHPYFPIKSKRSEKSSKCFVYVLAAFVTLCALLLAFSTICLRTNTPDVKLLSVTVQNLRLKNTTNATSPSFNATLVTQLSIKNKNFGSFEFQNSTGSVSYGGVAFGDMKIRGGRVEVKDSERMNVSVDLRSRGYSENSTNLSSDINSGKLTLKSYAKLIGRVHLFHILEKERTPELNCSMTLVFGSQGIEDLVCS